MFKNTSEARRFAEWEALVLRYAPYGSAAARLDRVATAVDRLLDEVSV